MFLLQEKTEGHLTESKKFQQKLDNLLNWLSWAEHYLARENEKRISVLPSNIAKVNFEHAVSYFSSYIFVGFDYILEFKLNFPALSPLPKAADKATGTRYFVRRG